MFSTLTGNLVGKLVFDSDCFYVPLHGTLCVHPLYYTLFIILGMQHKLKLPCATVQICACNMYVYSYRSHYMEDGFCTLTMPGKDSLNRTWLWIGGFCKHIVLEIRVHTHLRDCELSDECEPLFPGHGYQDSPQKGGCNEK